MNDSSKTQPHILLIMADQLRADHLSASGHPVLRTPHIDQLAEQGVRFTHAFTTSPLCCPARHSLARGLYPHNSHCWMDPDCMSGDADTYMRRLQTGGYRTGLIGKSHLYWQENVDLKPFENYMHQLGFEDLFETVGTWSNVGADTVYADYLKQHGLFEVHCQYLRKLDAMADTQRRFLAEASPLPAEHVLDSFIERTAVDYVRDYNDSRPSFLFVGFQGPHEPCDAPQPYASMYAPEEMPDSIPARSHDDWLSDCAREYARYAQYFQPDDPYKLKQIKANYCGKISLIDDWVGQIIKAYKDKGWLDNTVVIFVSDHGEMLGDLDRVSKSMFFESALRIPLIIRMPGQHHGGRVLDAMVELVDLFPTIINLAQCGPPPYTDGIDLWPLIYGKTDHIRNDILGEVHVHTMLRTDNVKYVINRSGEGLQLFDLSNDPHEETNLIGHRDHSQLEKQMRHQLLERLLRTQMILGDRDPAYSQHTLISP